MVACCWREFSLSTGELSLVSGLRSLGITGHVSVAQGSKAASAAPAAFAALAAPMAQESTGALTALQHMDHMQHF